MSTDVVIVRGGKGRDVLNGGTLALKNTFKGEPGDDDLIGRPADDRLYGNAGADDVEGYAGSDLSVAPRPRRSASLSGDRRRILCSDGLGYVAVPDSRSMHDESDTIDVGGGEHPDVGLLLDKGERSEPAEPVPFPPQVGDGGSKRRRDPDRCRLIELRDVALDEKGPLAARSHPC